MKNHNGIIFGSTGVLGTILSSELANLDFNLILHGRSIDKLKKLSDKISKKKKPSLFQGDVTQKEFYENLFRTISKKYNKIDFIINLIGQFDGLKPLTHLSHGEWDKFIEINISSYWRILKELEPLSRKSENPKFITITNSSIASGKAYHNIFSVCLSARNSMLKTLKEENKNLNFKIFSIEMKQINTGMSSSLSGKKNINKKELQNISKDIIETCFKKINFIKKDH